MNYPDGEFVNSTVQLGQFALQTWETQGSQRDKKVSGKPSRSRLNEPIFFISGRDRYSEGSYPDDIFKKPPGSWRTSPPQAREAHPAASWLAQCTFNWRR